MCLERDDESGGEDEKTIIRWQDVSAIKKRKCLARDTAISIHYSVTGEKEQKELFLYGFSQRDEVAGVMDQLWQNIMQKVLRSVENNSTLLLHSSNRLSTGVGVK